MRVVLDTDHLSILQRQQQPECDRLEARLDALPGEDVVTTVVNFQEQILGWTAYLNRARTAAAVLKAYRELLLIESYYRDFELLPFDAAAHDRFEDLRRQMVCVATLDLRIACITLVHGATLLTRNLRDFRQVSGLRFEDWSR
jgi:tRNA(fMet)-specific endonuclease VapC